MHAGIARPALVTVAGALAAGWLLAACSGTETTDTEETTTTTTTEAPATTEGDNTIEIPSPNIDVPEVTMTPAP
ncbi:hypothetical protein ABQF17_20305 [Mycolicibacterium elephantis]|uniref:hypothetical protein n=1 Tax=Mycolicibacterium elephantis TaxID=81858 RepID=UPI0007E97935|nr:hypothetical protein [Mycolicibacterium elephantis]OBA77464.1 hypothetical protein A5633_18370 [Mycolicibacterium elephantis]OBB17338.1 hypothetical protein A5762_24120 [Mycolicibacterium elephantis]OBE99220.1 hypothetical protein A5776_11825 [Mycolicibacterium elephantis]